MCDNRHYHWLVAMQRGCGKGLISEIFKSNGLLVSTKLKVSETLDGGENGLVYFGCVEAITSIT